MLIVLIPGYRKMKEFIVTQHPTESTIDDFWQMVWDHNAQTIVLISDIDEAVSFSKTCDVIMSGLTIISNCDVILSGLTSISNCDVRPSSTVLTCIYLSYGSFNNY